MDCEDPDRRLPAAWHILFSSSSCLRRWREVRGRVRVGVGERRLTTRTRVVARTLATRDSRDERRATSAPPAAHARSHASSLPLVLRTSADVSVKWPPNGPFTATLLVQVVLVSQEGLLTLAQVTSTAPQHLLLPLILEQQN